MFTLRRIDAPELLDEGDVPPADVERSLRDIRWINRWLGGIALYRRLVRRVAPDRRRPLTLLDVGTGTSDLLESVRDYQTLVRVGVDIKIEHLLYLRNGSLVHRVVGDALRLPFRDGSADVVTSSHFFHHFSPEANAGILRDSLRVARHAVVVNDTVRHHTPLLTVRLLSLLRVFGRITRYDAPASVLRGYTVAEALAVAEHVGAARSEVINVFPYRFAIVLKKSDP
ncbi:MAG TPA: methyltransferase domain-containing protein [Thermoanaerobaculia bacterium]|nr:methyltransferase domain-containing protein [Thermoanaerobaculia bacterium]